MRRIVALLIAAVFLVAVQPGAMAMPATSTHSSMQMMNCGSQETTKRDHSMPMQKHGTPCNDMGNCLGMLNCFAAAVMPANNQALLLTVATSSPFRHLQEAGSSLALQPDNPPPIA